MQKSTNAHITNTQEEISAYFMPCHGLWYCLCSCSFCVGIRVCALCLSVLVFVGHSFILFLPVSTCVYLIVRACACVRSKSVRLVLSCDCFFACVRYLCLCESVQVPLHICFYLCLSMLSVLSESLFVFVHVFAYCNYSVTLHNQTLTWCAREFVDYISSRTQTCCMFCFLPPPQFLTRIETSVECRKPILIPYTVG